MDTGQNGAIHEGSDDASVVLALRDIRMGYDPGRMALELPVLDICCGRVYAVVGANGAGKTTLFKLLTLLVRPQQGRLMWHGQELQAATARALQALRQQVVLVSQQPLLFRTSVFHNVAYGLKMRRVARTEIAPRVAAALKQVDMAAYAQRSARQLSGGEAQRVALARALVLEPEVFLFDEPTANLDTHSRQIIETLISNLRRQHRHTVLFTTHDMAQAYRLSDEVIALEQGQRVAHTLENVLRGALVRRETGPCFRTGNVEIVLPEDCQQASCIAIAPEDIVLSPKPFTSSARNSFAGRVVEVSALGSQLHIVVDIGERLHVRITKQSYATLGLNVGSPTHVTFKASAVQVYA